MQIIPIRASRPALAPAPIILPRDTDDICWERAEAWDRAFAAAYRSKHGFAVVARQADYARRLDALAMLRGRE